MNPRRRLRRVFQLERLEDRRTCSSAVGGMEAVTPQTTSESGPRAAQEQSLPDRGQRLRDAAARRRIDRAFAVLDRSIAGFDRAIDRLEIVALSPAASRGVNRAIARVSRAATQLDRSLGARPHVVQAADLVAVQRDLDEIGRLQEQALLLLQRTVIP